MRLRKEHWSREGPRLAFKVSFRFHVSFFHFIQERRRKSQGKHELSWDECGGVWKSVECV
jgi:hypothetical protein